MQFKFEIDLDVTGITVAPLVGYAVIETNEFDPDDGWSIGGIVLDGTVGTGSLTRPFWRDEQVTLPQDAEASIGNALAEYVMTTLVNDYRDDISEKFQEFLADNGETAGEARFEAHKHEVA
jgi:hypothetical protein